MILLRLLRALCYRLRIMRPPLPDDGLPLRSLVVTADEVAQHCLPVSRHGVQDAGIRCPRCSELAVDAGDWSQIHSIQRPGEVLEEAACCWNCQAFLLASPDDEIDPIKQGDSYDKSIYHRFVRPPGWSPPRQTTLDRDPRVGDWIVVWESCRSGEREMLNSEGLVTEITDGQVSFRPAGLIGVAKRVETVPQDAVRVMTFETFRRGMRVLIKRGPEAGVTGTIDAVAGANLEVITDRGRRIPTTQERVKRLELE